MCPFSAVKIIWNIPSWQNENAFYRELFATERCPLRKVWNLIYLLNIVYIHLIYLISRIVNSFTQYRVWSHHLCKRSHTRLFISRRIFFCVYCSHSYILVFFCKFNIVSILWIDLYYTNDWAIPTPHKSRGRVNLSALEG